jgi:dual specificity MAP kinase phosphatase
MNNLEPKGRNDEHKFDFSKITDQIYIGSDLCRGGVCIMHGEEFKKLGVGLELNLSQEENELPPKDMEIGYLWLPVVDGYAPSQTQLGIGVSAIHEAIKSGKKVYVHCKNGHARSPSLVAAYLMKHGGYILEDAVKLIKEKREEVHIEDSQIEALREFGSHD